MLASPVSEVPECPASCPTHCNPRPLTLDALDNVDLLDVTVRFQDTSVDSTSLPARSFSFQTRSSPEYNGICQLYVHLFKSVCVVCVNITSSNMPREGVHLERR